jgi:transporter family-2 protein
MTQIPFYLLMLIAGMGIPIMAAINASVGANIQSPVAAVAVLCGVALLATLSLLLFLPKPNWTDLVSQPPGYYLAGLLFILYIGGITIAAPRIGVGNAVLLVLLGQLVSAALIDHFGLFGAPVATFNKTRALGLLLVALGVLLARKNVLPVV